MPVNDDALNKSSPYIFESKCFSNSQCVGDYKRDDNRSTIISSYMCGQINGTIDKVGLFSIAEFNYPAKKIMNYVYIVMEGCSFSEGDRINEPLTWILTNDTKFTKQIIRKYKMNLPLNDNNLYFGEMTFGGGDRNCSNLCAPLVCEQSMEGSLERDEDLEVNTTLASTTSTTQTTPKPKKIKKSVSETNVFTASSGLIIYVAFGVILVVAFLCCITYRKYMK